MGHQCGGTVNVGTNGAVVSTYQCGVLCSDYAVLNALSSVCCQWCASPWEKRTIRSAFWRIRGFARRSLTVCGSRRMKMTFYVRKFITATGRAYPRLTAQYIFFFSFLLRLDRGCHLHDPRPVHDYATL